MGACLFVEGSEGWEGKAREVAMVCLFVQAPIKHMRGMGTGKGSGQKMELERDE